MKTRYFGLVLGALLVHARALADDATLQADAASAAIARGANQPALFVEEKVLKKDELGVARLKLKAKQCVIIAAAVGTEIPDVLLSLKPAEGAWMSDGAEGRTATLRYCGGSKDERIVMRTRVRTQATRVALAAFALAADANETAQATDATHAVSTAQDEPKRDERPLRQRLATLVDQNALPLSSPMTPAREEDVGVRDPRTREVSLTGGFCYRVYVVAAHSIQNLSVSLHDRAGKELTARQNGKGSIVFPKDVAFCPPATGNYQVSLHATEGSGALLWQLHGGPNQARVYAFPVGGKEDGLLARRLRALQPKVGESKPAVMQLRQGHLKTSETLDAIFNVEEGACYIAVAVGTPSLRSLDLELTDQRGNIVAQAQDKGNAPSLRACAQVPGQWRVRAGAFKGYGDVAIQVFGGR